MVSIKAHLLVSLLYFLYCNPLWELSKVPSRDIGQIDNTRLPHPGLARILKEEYVVLKHASALYTPPHTELREALHAEV